MSGSYRPKPCTDRLIYLHTLKKLEKYFRLNKEILSRIELQAWNLNFKLLKKKCHTYDHFQTSHAKEHIYRNVKYYFLSICKEVDLAIVNVRIINT